MDGLIRLRGCHFYSTLLFSTVERKNIYETIYEDDIFGCLSYRHPSVPFGRFSQIEDKIFRNQNYGVKVTWNRTSLSIRIIDNICLLIHIRHANTHRLACAQSLYFDRYIEIKELLNVITNTVVKAVQYQHHIAYKDFCTIGNDLVTNTQYH